MLRKKRITPDQTHLHLLEGISFRPIFILGPHRSGTTILFNLLASSGAFNYLTLHQIVYYDQLLDDHLNGRTSQVKQELIDRFDRLGYKDRVFDGIPLSPDAPEEYGFVLQVTKRNPLVTMLRPYHGPFANRFARHLQLNGDTVALFSEMCRKIQFLAGADRPILLKNPYDFNNFKEILRHFPAAKFIFNHRHSLHVLNSQVRTLHSIFSSKNEALALIGRDYAAMYKDSRVREANRRTYAPGNKKGILSVLPSLTWTANHFVEEVRGFPAEHYVSLRYEDLCSNPRRQIGRLLDFLGLRPEREVAFDTIQPRQQKLLPEIEAEGPRIRASLSPYLTYNGYEL
ncbi:MAG: sulfotransferase [Chloroflexota bacterium]